MDLRSTNLIENRGALWGRGFCPAAGLPPGVVWDGDAPGETTRTQLFRGVKCPQAGKKSDENHPPCSGGLRRWVLFAQARRIFDGAAWLPPGVSWCTGSADLPEFPRLPELEDAGRKPGGGAEAPAPQNA